MSRPYSHARDRSNFRLTISAALFFAAGIALAGQAETAAPLRTEAEPRTWHSPASTGPTTAGQCAKFNA